jgi:hypothetical protein
MMDFTTKKVYLRLMLAKSKLRGFMLFKPLDLVKLDH